MFSVKPHHGFILGFSSLWHANQPIVPLLFQREVRLRQAGSEAQGPRPHLSQREEGQGGRRHHEDPRLRQPQDLLRLLQGLDGQRGSVRIRQV